MDTHVEVSECTPSPFILVVLLKLNEVIHIVHLVIFISQSELFIYILRSSHNQQLNEYIVVKLSWTH